MAAAVMIAAMIAAMIATNKLRPRVGPRPLVVAGMLLGAGGMLYLTRLGVASSYATGILPALVMLGVGFGLGDLHLDQQRHPRRQARRRGRRLRDRLGLPADRRVARRQGLAAA
jgi:hypothetical protein